MPLRILGARPKRLPGREMGFTRGSAPANFRRLLSDNERLVIPKHVDFSLQYRQFIVITRL